MDDGTPEGKCTPNTIASAACLSKRSIFAQSFRFRPRRRVLNFWTCDWPLHLHPACNVLIRRHAAEPKLPNLGHTLDCARQINVCTFAVPGYVLGCVTLLLTGFRHSAASYPTPNQTEIVKPILKALGTSGMKENLEKFTTFRTRCTISNLPLQLWLIVNL